MPENPRAAEFAEICVKFGIPRGRAGLIGNEIAEAIAKPHKKECQHCGKPFRSKRSDAAFCSDSCRVMASRQRSA